MWATICSDPPSSVCSLWERRVPLIFSSCSLASPKFPSNWVPPIVLPLDKEGRERPLPSAPFTKIELSPSISPQDSFPATSPLCPLSSSSSYQYLLSSIFPFYFRSRILPLSSLPSAGKVVAFPNQVWNLISLVSRKNLRSLSLLKIPKLEPYSSMTSGSSAIHTTFPSCNVLLPSIRKLGFELFQIENFGKRAPACLSMGQVALDPTFFFVQALLPSNSEGCFCSFLKLFCMVLVFVVYCAIDRRHLHCGPILYFWCVTNYFPCETLSFADGEVIYSSRPLVWSTDLVNDRDTLKTHRWKTVVSKFMENF